MFGNSGYNPKGVRVGGSSVNKSAVKVWEKREYKNLDDKVSLNTRNIQIALKRLRKFCSTKEVQNLEFDLKKQYLLLQKMQDLLTLKYRPERTNKVRVLLFIDIGGSMDEHAKICEEIFSAANREFKSLDFFYFTIVYMKVFGKKI